MAIQLADNILPPYSSWQLNNATANEENNLVIQPGGSATYELRKIDNKNLVPELFCIKAHVANNQPYAPKLHITVDLFYTADSYSTFYVPLDTWENIEAKIYPTVDTYTNEVSTFLKIVLTIEYSADSVSRLVLSNLSLQPSFDKEKQDMQIHIDENSEAFESMQVGGNNILIGTNQGVTNWIYFFAEDDPVQGTCEAYDYLGIHGVKLTCPGTPLASAYAAFKLGETRLYLDSDTDYCLSFDLLTNVSDTLFVCIKGATDNSALTDTAQQAVQADEMWHKLVFKLHTIVDVPAKVDAQNVVFNSFTKQGYFCIKNLKIEEGNVATAWSPAPADFYGYAEKHFSDIQQTTDHIQSQVTAQRTDIETAKTAADEAKDVAGRVEIKQTTLEQTSKDFSIEIKNEVNDIKDNGVDKVTTSKGFTFNDEGLNISSSKNQMMNTLDETGMEVKNAGTSILSAKAEGVNTLNLTARQYLICGGHARFEKYIYNGEERVGCFWI